MNVFLTGVTGYLGGAIAEALQHSGHMVLGLARSDTSAKVLQERSMSALRGDLRDPASLEEGARQADAVIHAASTNSSDMAEVDIAAVDAILTTLEGTNKPFIYTSGCWVLGNSGESIADEASPTDPPAIVAWRPALERHILAAAARGVHAIMLRPANVYGRAGGIPAMLINLARQNGTARYIGTGENHCPMVQVDDLSNAYVRALTQAPAGTLINIPGGPARHFKEIAQAISMAAGLGGRTGSWTLEEARQVLGALADALALDLQFSGARAGRLLDWSPHAPSILDDLVHGSYHAETPSTL